MTVVGVVPMTEPDPRWLLEGLLRHQPCQLLMQRAVDDARRVYRCPGCAAAVDKVPVEQDMLMGALTRAYVALHQVGRPHAPTSIALPGIEGWTPGDQAHISPQEVCAWQRTSITDRLAVLRTAYGRLVVDAAGNVSKTWRDHSAQLPVTAAP